MDMNRTLSCCLGLGLLLAGTASSGEAPPGLPRQASFAKKPAASRAGGAVKIDFAASRETDAAVRIENAAGKVVRHLAAGLLGAKAPAPFRPGLVQSLEWDGKDDAGRQILSPSRGGPAAGGPFRVRVRLGTGAAFDRVLGWDPQTVFPKIVAVAPSPRGEVFVFLSNVFLGDFAIRVYDRDFKYLRTVLPYPASLPPEKVRGFGDTALTRERGMPLVYYGHTGNVTPFTAGMCVQNPVFLADGRLAFMSSPGSYAEHCPPVHVLTVNPDGSCPPGGFIGPQILEAYGFLGGGGGASGYRPAYLAVSPDGKSIYAPSLNRGGWFDKKLTAKHVVFKVGWEDKGLPKNVFAGQANQPGGDEKHLNSPRGVATDAEGNVYVCDTGNGRLVVFDPAGAFLGQTGIERPEQVAVSPDGKLVFVLCHTGKKDGKGNFRATGYRLVRLSGARDGKVAASIEAKMAWLGQSMGSALPTIGLDHGAKPPVLWLGAGFTLTKLDTNLKPLGELKGNNRLAGPDTVLVDPDRDRLYVLSKTTYGPKGIDVVDLKTGEVSPFPKGGTEIALDPDGNVYTVTGYLKTHINRFTPEGEPLPFPATGKNTIGPFTDIWRNGFAVAPDGDIYVLHAKQATPVNLDVWSPDGKEKRKGLITRLPNSPSGIGVDAGGNVYVGLNVKPPGRPYPEGFGKYFPEKNWYFWGRHRAEQAPWRNSYINQYFFFWGSVFKFSPEGGAWFWKAGKDGPDPQPPAGAANFKQGPKMDKDLWARGVVWYYQGLSTAPSNHMGASGDPGCQCWTARFATDAFGRCFVPDCLRFSVAVIDTGGNELLRLGSYGNMDSRGPGSPIPKPEIPVGWGPHVAVGGDRLYISDRMNQRVTVVRLTCAAEESCSVR
jgi:DNA-binding beta-propeller fold protein YncE